MTARLSVQKGRDGAIGVQNGPPAPVHVDIVVTPRCFASSVAITVDVLSTASLIAESLGRGEPVFVPRIVSLDGKRVVSSAGVAIEVDGTADSAHGDVVVVCGPGMADVRQVLNDIRSESTRVLTDVLRTALARGALLCASCSSTFLLAETGALDGFPATTSWWLGPTFRATYPSVHLTEDRLVVDAGSVVTAAAALTHIDLVLHLVRRFAGATLAESCAKYLVVDDSRRSQAPFRLIEHLAQGDAAVSDAQALIRANPAKPPSLQQLARTAGVTPRTLTRHFVSVTGLSPQRFVRRVRLELAAQLLRNTNETIRIVAHRVGYDDERAFRRAFEREFGSPPSRYRVGAASVAPLSDDLDGM